MIYKSNCSCTENKQITIFVTPETCQTEAHQHHKHDNNDNELSCSLDECEDCKNHTDDCGCSSPEAVYLKLLNQVIDEEVKFIEIQPIKIFTAFCNINILVLYESERYEKLKYYVDQPSIFTSSHDFLIQIQKLKIPLIA
ncbi:MAG: hypothetical protein GQ525_15495 [Draconibacterium sp.]|nr:hypothetical protein [Draconibacterium sp.]